jgi:hypothetical protein
MNIALANREKEIFSEVPVLFLLSKVSVNLKRVVGDILNVEKRNMYLLT